MKLRILLMVLACILAAYSVASSPNEQKALVKWVYDGDTIRVRADNNKNLKVRVIGIDCPESRYNDKCERDELYGKKSCKEQIPLGKKAKKRALELLTGKQVLLECDDNCKKDSYKRALRYIRLPDGRDFGLIMVEEGLCREISQAFPHPRSEKYKNAERKHLVIQSKRQMSK